MIFTTLPDAIKVSVDEVEHAAEVTLQKAAEFARDAALATDLFKVSDSFKNHTQFHTLDKYNGFILADTPFAQYLEYGNNQVGPFIYPVNTKALHFVVGGKDVFVKRVRTHGPLPFMQNASDKLDNEIVNIFNNELNRKLT